MNKTAVTAAPLHPLLAERWSPRAFDPQYELTDVQLTALLEAARWAPSASNTQPWRFAVTRRGSLGDGRADEGGPGRVSTAHTAVFGALAPGNQAWAHAASALIVASAETAGPDGAEREWAVYDTGQAVAHLSMQAQHEGLAVHQMGGFDRDRLAAALPPCVTPVAVLAVGRRDDPARLVEPFAGRETATRDRLPLEALQLAVDPGPAVAIVA